MVKWDSGRKGNMESKTFIKTAILQQVLPASNRRKLMANKEVGKTAKAMSLQLCMQGVQHARREHRDSHGVNLLILWEH